ncbi:MAG: Do family serine endopeptidase [Marinifilaceae bacterium]
MNKNKLLVAFLFGSIGGGVVGGVLSPILSPTCLFTDKTESNAPQLVAVPNINVPITNVGMAGLPQNGVPGSVDLREAAKNSVPAVVHVKTVQLGREYVGNPLLDFWFGVTPRTREYPQSMGSGSGVVISEDGYIITNNHVIAGSDAVRVVLHDNREFKAKVIGTDPTTDIALLKIEAKGLKTMPIGNSDNVELGEWVLAVGNPYNLTSTVTAGIISAKARNLGGQMGLESFLQTDAAVNPGNSGGALVNSSGELIGINTAIQSPTGSYSGYSFAVPITIARKVIQDIKQYGKVQRAVLGIRPGELTPAYAEELKLNVKNGIYIIEIIPEGAAHKAGLKEGDVITHINGIGVETFPQFQEQLVRYNPGEVINLTVNRKGNVETKNVTLQNSYGNTSILTNNSTDILGAVVSPLSKEDRYRYRLDRGVKITKLATGKFKSAGLTENYIILKVNDRFVSSDEDLRRAIHAIGNEGVFVTAVNPRGRIEYFAFSLTD